MSVSKWRDRGGRLHGLVAALALAGALALPATAGAFTDGTTYMLDIKVPPSSFKAGTQLDIPVYLVENRPPANGGSNLAEHKLGQVDSSFASSQSKFLQFTPAAGLFAPAILAQENLGSSRAEARPLSSSRSRARRDPGWLSRPTTPASSAVPRS